MVRSFTLGAAPTTREAQAVADEIFADFVSKEVDKVELVFTKFVSLIASNPTIQTLLPLTPTGELCDVDGNCVDAASDEMFKLTTSGGQLAVEREKVVVDTPELDPSLIFEQDPVQILDALLPLYMNSCILRSLQEALASELAARMNAMNNATDNASELKKVLTVKYNKQRQSKITQVRHDGLGPARVIWGRAFRAKRSTGERDTCKNAYIHTCYYILIYTTACNTQEISEIVAGASATA